MSTVSPDTSTEMAMTLTDGCINNRMVQLSLFNEQPLFSSARHHYYISGIA